MRIKARNQRARHTDRIRATIRNIVKYNCTRVLLDVNAGDVRIELDPNIETIECWK